MYHVQDQGRACYKRGEYEKALEHFDRAIGHNPSVQLLDNRAACYEKLGQLQKALKDAKGAIHHQREDPTGYLRAGKVLLKMDKPTVACEIYGHGLRCIKHVGKGYELLKKAHKEVLDQVSPPKSVDPMTVLPRELAVQIMEYLSFKQRMNACLVSKQWTQFIRSCPDLWRCLDLSQSRKFVRNSFVSRAINTARSRLTSAVLGRYTDLDKALPAVSKHCHLEDLTLVDLSQFQLNTIHQMLGSATHLKKLSLASNNWVLSHDSITKLFESGFGDRMEWLSCLTVGHPSENPFVRSFRNLHTLELKMLYQSVFDELVAGISDRIPLLRSLTLHIDSSVRQQRFPEFPLVLRDCARLQHLDLKLALDAASRLILPPTLVVLKLHSLSTTPPTNFWFVAGAAGLEPHTFYLPSLEELHLEIPRMVLHNALHVIDDRQPQLSGLQDDAVEVSDIRTLVVRDAALNYKQADEALKHPRLTQLQHLHLPRLASCGDEDALQIIESAPNLQSLDLSETNITGIAVKRTLKLKHLRELTVNNCPKMYHDAIELARSHGVKVNYRMSDGMNGGKKVRQ